MALTVNAKSYVADNVGPNSVVYNGPAHTLSVMDDLNLRRTAPKPVKDFSGVAKVACKLTRTNTLTGALTPTAPMIADFSTSVPVGSASADIDAMLNDLGAFIASATYKDIVKKNMINF